MLQLNPIIQSKLNLRNSIAVQLTKKKYSSHEHLLPCYPVICRTTQNAVSKDLSPGPVALTKYVE
jgi:hypothetical protein